MWPNHLEGKKLRYVKKCVVMCTNPKPHRFRKVATSCSLALRSKEKAWSALRGSLCVWNTFLAFGAGLGGKEIASTSWG